MIQLNRIHLNVIHYNIQVTTTAIRNDSTAIQNDETWIESGNKPNGSDHDDEMKGRIKLSTEIKSKRKKMTKIYIKH